MGVDLSEAADELYASCHYHARPYHFEGHDGGQMHMYRIHSASLVCNDASTPSGVRDLKSPSNADPRAEFYAIYQKELKGFYRDYTKGALGGDDTGPLFVFLYSRTRCLRPSPP